MRNRPYGFVIRVSEEEQTALNKMVAQSGMSRESYVRCVLGGYRLTTLPPQDSFRLAKEVRAAGNTLNRIAAALYARGFLDAPAYQRNAEKVLGIADEMHMALAPRKE